MANTMRKLYGINLLNSHYRRCILINIKPTIILLFLLASIQSCTKSEESFIDGNKPPKYNSVPTIKVENYINRLFIDLLGREATDSERIERTNYLKEKELSFDARVKIITELQEDSSYRIGDSSYRHAYYQRIYDLSKARFLEGATDGEISQFIGNLNFAIKVSRLNGDSIGVYSALAAKARYEKILRSKREYRTGLITYSEMCAAMLNNDIYDQINMNSFNFVFASFDDLFGRNPTQDEFTRAYDIIDKNIPREIFGKWAANKNEYCEVLTTSAEFYESQIRWVYYVLLQREATTQEVINLYTDFALTRNMQKVQLQILKTDEYAQFLR